MKTKEGKIDKIQTIKSRLQVSDGKYMGIISKRRKSCKCTFYQLMDYGFPIKSLKCHAGNCPLFYCIYSKDPTKVDATAVCSECGIGLCSSCGYRIKSIVLCNECHDKITEK